MKKWHEDLISLGVVLFFSFLASYVLPYAHHLFDDSYWLFSLGLPTIFFSLLLFILCIALIQKEQKWNNKGNLIRRIGLSNFSIKDFCVASGIFLLLVVLTILVNFFLEKLGGISMKNAADNAITIKNLGPNKYSVYLYISGVLLTAIIEEVFWRGYLLPRQKKRIGDKAWILNGLLWGLSHLFAYNPLKIAVFAFGYPFIAHKFNNIWYTIIFHLIINGYVSFLFLRNLGYLS